MKAIQIVDLSGPETALREVDLPEPEASHMLTPGSGVVVDVRAAGVSFPEVLQTRGEYQVKPPLPFVPGSEVAGTVRSAPEGSALSPGDRVAAFPMLGGFAEVAVAPEFLTFPLPDELDFRQGASLILNYHTAWFSLVIRGRLKAGETVLIHGAAGGVGTASIQVAKGRRSADDRRRLDRREGARRPRRRRRRGRPLRRRVARSGQGAVRAAGWTSCSIRSAATASPTRCARSPRAAGSSSSASPAGSIPEVKVNRLLLNNTEVIGAGWGAYVIGKPDLNREIGAELAKLIASGRRPAAGRRRVPAQRRRRHRGAAADRRPRRHRQGRPRRRLMARGSSCHRRLERDR